MGKGASVAWAGITTFSGTGKWRSNSLANQTITVSVAQTPGVTFNSQANGFPGGALRQTWTTSGGTITYSFVLAAGQTIPAGYASGVVYAQSVEPDPPMP